MQFLQECCLRSLGLADRRLALGRFLSRILDCSSGGETDLDAARRVVTDYHTRIELIMESARRGHVKTTQFLMDLFDWGTQQLHHGHSMFVIVVLFGEDDLVDFFLSQEVKPLDLTDLAGVNPVLAAVAGGDRPEILKKLLDLKFSVVSETGRNALVEANASYSEENCKILLMAGASVREILQIGPFWLTNYFVAAGWGREGELHNMLLRSEPPSLQSFCRFAIRQSVDLSENNLFPQVEKLRLPEKLKQFILWG